MDGLRNDGVLEAEDDAESERVLELAMHAIEDDMRRMAKAIVSRRDDALLGPGEFDLRDRMLKAASHVLEAAISDRKKGGIKAAARRVPGAAAMPGLSGGESRRS